MEHLLEHHLALKSFLDQWSKRQEEILHSAFPCQKEAPAKLQHPTEPPSLGNVEDLRQLGSDYDSQQELEQSITLHDLKAEDSGSFVSWAEHQTDQSMTFGVLSNQLTGHTRPSLLSADQISTGLKSHFVEVLANRSSFSAQAVSKILSSKDLRSRRRNFGVRDCLSKIVRSSYFESFIAVVILFNAALMSVAANHEMQHPSSPSEPAMDYVELVLFAIYSGELLMRIVVYGFQYFRDENWKWNWFDMFLVGMSLHDYVMPAIVKNSSSSAVNLSFFRMLRLLKMLKLLRMIRLMKMFKELRLILYAVMGCVKAMFWASMLILIISYVAGILFVQACAHYLKDAGSGASLASQQLIQEYWSSVGTAMLSLFMACTAGKGWVDVASPLMDAGPVWYAVFVVYIAFFTFVIMNTLTSLFVETVMDHTHKDLEMNIQLELDKKDQYIKMMRGVFQAIDSENRGVVSYEDFESHLDNPQIQGFFYSMEIDIMNAKKFFHILSADGTKAVDLEQFVVGCIKLKGNARSVDLIEFIHSHKKYAAETMQHLQTLERISQHLVSLAGVGSGLDLASAGSAPKARANDWTGHDFAQTPHSPQCLSSATTLGLPPIHWAGHVAPARTCGPTQSSRLSEFVLKSL